jgi:hypothetical protein
MSARAHPLQWPKGWPKTELNKREAGNHFKNVTLASALNGLKDEVRRLDGKNVVLSSNYTLGNESPKESGVVAYFEYNGSQVAIPCDRWKRIEINVRAIALAIEAMRGMERWGAKHMIAAMFSGFTALPEKTGPSCWDVLGISSDATEDQILNAYRSKAKKAHPDQGGSSEAFNALSQAKDIALATRRSS